MSDEFLNDQAKEALRLRTKGHTYNYIAKELNMTPEQAKVIVQEEMHKTAIMRELEGERVTEITIRLTTPKMNARAAFHIRELMEQLYKTEAEWEKGFASEENAGDIVLAEPTTFSVSVVVVNNAPQTGKNVIFPDME